MQMEKVAAIGRAMRPSILDNLRSRQASLRQQLDDVTAAIDAMESNPEAAKLLETVSKVANF